MASFRLHQVHVDEEKIEGAEEEEVDIEEVEVVLLDPVGEHLGEGQGEPKDDEKLCVEGGDRGLEGVAA